MCLQWLKKTKRKALSASLDKIKEGELLTCNFLICFKPFLLRIQKKKILCKNRVDAAWPHLSTTGAMGELDFPDLRRLVPLQQQVLHLLRGRLRPQDQDDDDDGERITDPSRRDQLHPIPCLRHGTLLVTLFLMMVRNSSFWCYIIIMFRYC